MNKVMFTRLGASTRAWPNASRPGTLLGTLAALYGTPLGAVWDVHGQEEQDKGDQCVKMHSVPEAPIISRERMGQVINQKEKSGGHY